MGVGVDPVVSGPPGNGAVELAPLRPEDLQAVMEIEQRSFSSPWSPGMFLHELRLPFSRTLVAMRVGTDQRKVLGYVCRWLVGDEIQILNLAVAPEERGRGVGKLLLDAVLAEARERGLRRVTLEVAADNAPGIRLYRSAGFSIVGRRRRYYRDGGDALVMRCGIGPEPEESG